MWGKSKSNPKATVNGRFDTLISNKTRIEGDIHFTGGLHIDGKVIGKIQADDDNETVVRISDLGEIHGDVVAPHVVINGRVFGNVYSNKHIELAPKASIEGNVYYNLIEMAMGAEVNGSLVHTKTDASKPKSAKVDKAPKVETTETAADEQVVDLGVNLGGRRPQTR